MAYLRLLLLVAKQYSKTNCSVRDEQEAVVPTTTLLLSHPFFCGDPPAEKNEPAAKTFPDCIKKQMPTSITDGALAWQRLAVVNPHPRDARITFDEASHTYTIDGSRQGWTSCTQFIGGFYEHFDPDTVIANMMRSRKWPASPYYGMTAEAIKTQWSDSGTAASGAGTQMHLDIEHYYNAEPVGNLAGDDYTPTPGPEWDYFQAFERRWRQARGFVPFRTEWLVFKEDIKLAGSIDMIYTKPDGTLAIYDWKRTKELKYENKWQKMKAPLDHLPDTNYWHYSLQLNIYRRVLQELYDVVVSELALVVLHPNQTSFRVVKLNMMDDEVEAMMESRRAAMAAATATAAATAVPTATATAAPI